MPEIKYHELRQKAIDPNRARWYALGLLAVAALFACLTIKTNWDYFEQYFTGLAFWMRVIPFMFGVEGLIIILPLFKGFGNKAQGWWAIIFKVALMALAGAHTYLVSDYTIAQKAASKTKQEAVADLGARQAEVDKIASANQKARESYERQQKNYSTQMRYWYDAAAVARLEGRKAPPAPKAPDPPQPLEVPKVSQGLVDNASLSVEQAGAARVSHQTLQRLLFAMVALASVAIMTMVGLADGTRVRSWFLLWRAKAVNNLKGETENLPTTAQNLSASGPQGQPASAPPPRQLPPVPPPPGPKIRRFRQVGEPPQRPVQAPSGQAPGRNGTSGKV